MGDESGQQERQQTAVAQPDERVLVELEDLMKLVSASRPYRVSTYVGSATGACLVAFGCLLTVFGIRGDLIWVFEGAGLTSKLWNLSPGAFFVAIGAMVVLVIGLAREKKTVTVRQGQQEFHVTSDQQMP